MRGLYKLIIHCADTKAGMDIGVEEITQWHKARGFNNVGYHFVIRKNGTIEKGRDIDVIGAHCKGQNSHSIGICWVGGYDAKDDRTDAQKEAMQKLVISLNMVFGKMSIHGHNEFSTKTCPNFNVYEEFKELLEKLCYI